MVYPKNAVTLCVKLYVVLPSVYNGEEECQTALYTMKNEPVKSYGIVQTTQLFVLIGDQLIISTVDAFCIHDY